MDDKGNRKRAQVLVAYAMLPFILGVPPIVGFYIGLWVDKHFHIAPYGMYTFLVLGIVAGGRECYFIVKKYNDN